MNKTKVTAHIKYRSNLHTDTECSTDKKQEVINNRVNIQHIDMNRHTGQYTQKQIAYADKLLRHGEFKAPFIKPSFGDIAWACY